MCYHTRDNFGIGESLRFSNIRGLLWGWEKIEVVVADGLEKRLAKVPAENLKSPEPEVAVPALQALTYTAQNDTLREMFLNLLASSMDSTKDSIVHPSYVEIVKQMNSLDAKVFSRLVSINHNVIAVTPRVSVKGTSKFFTNAFPEWYLGWTVENCDYFDLSACLIRLERLGIIKLMYDRRLMSADYTSLESGPFLESTLARYQQGHPDKELVLEFTNDALYVNDFGKQFAKCCI